MNSPHALLYIALQQMIKAITGDDDQPVFRFIEYDFGQLENYVPPGKPPLSFPVALISIDDAEYTNMGENGQLGSIRVQLRLGFDPYSATSNLSPEEYRNKALQFFENEQAVYKAMHGQSPDTATVTTSPSVTADLSDIFGYLMRIKAHTEKRQDFLHVRVITFTLSHNDWSASQPITYTPADPVITYDLQP